MKYRDIKADRTQFYQDERSHLEKADPLERRLMRAFNEHRPDVNVCYARGCIFINGHKIFITATEKGIFANYKGELMPFASTIELLEYFVDHAFCKLTRADICYIAKHAELITNQFKAHRYERIHKK
jgi:hypothetical protein